MNTVHALMVVGLDASAVAEFNVLLDTPNIDEVPAAGAPQAAAQAPHRPPEPERPPPASAEEIDAANQVQLMSMLALPRAGQVAGPTGVG